MTATTSKQSIGELMTPARERLGLSMNECARRIGISPFFWHQVERNKELPSEEVLKAISRVLCLPHETISEVMESTKKKKADTRAAEKEVVMWMRQNKLDPRVVLEQLRGTTWKA